MIYCSHPILTLFLQSTGWETSSGCPSSNTERTGALLEVSRGGQHPSVPPQRQLPWSSATGWCRPFRYHLTTCCSSIFYSLSYTSLKLKKKKDLLSPVVFIFLDCVPCRPLQRRCMTSSLPLRPWAVWPSQRVAPHPAGPAGLFSQLTSERAWPRPTTPSERCVLQKNTLQLFSSHWACANPNMFFFTPSREWSTQPRRCAT